MRRLRLSSGLVFGILFALALIVLLPMRLALEWVGLDARGLAAREVSGSVWTGRLSDARFGDLALGDVRAGVSPFQLLAGRARVNLAGRTPGTDKALVGALGVSRRSFGLDDVTAAVLARHAFAPLPVSQLELDDVSVRFEGTNCVRASGRVRAMMSGGIGAVLLPAVMSGTARCERNKLLLPLVSQSATEAVNLRIDGDGAYRAELVVQPSDATSSEQLALVGFVQGPAGYRLSVDGHF
ncbi:MAG: type II secretion system protein N [Sphingomonas sp.]